MAASKSMQRFLIQQMASARKKRDEEQRAQKIAEMAPQIIGQQAQPAQEQITSPYQQNQMFPGEDPIQGLMNIDQQAQEAKPATGLFDMGMPAQNRMTAFNERLMSSGMPSLQKQGLENLSKMSAGGSDLASARTFAMGAVGGKMQRAYLGADGKPVDLGVPYDPRNPYLDTGTSFVNPNAPGSNVDINNYGKAFDSQTGKTEVIRTDKTLAEMDKQINTLGKNIQLYGEGMDKIDDGAITGFIENTFLPSFRQSTIELENIGQKLGLEVIQNTTFGALSAGEMELAMNTAMPRNLKPAALRKWLSDKKTAQTKLRKQLIKYRRYRATHTQDELYALQARDENRTTKAGKIEANKTIKNLKAEDYDKMTMEELKDLRSRL